MHVVRAALKNIDKRGQDLKLKAGSALSADQCSAQSGRGEAGYTDNDLAGLTREGSSQGGVGRIVAKAKGLIATPIICCCGGWGSCSHGLITKRGATVEAGNDVVDDAGDLQQGAEEV